VRTLSGRVALAALLLLVCACAEQAPDRQQLVVGLHDLELVAPEGWQHYDHGLQHRFENGSSHMTLTDHGAVFPKSFLREIRQARDLFHQERSMDARAILHRLSLRSAFPSQESWEAFDNQWRVLRRIGGSRPIVPDEVESAFTQAMAQIEALPAPGFTSVAIEALEGMFQGAHRELAQQQAMAVSGHDALLIDTWDRLTHDNRKSYLFVLNKGNLLVVRMESGRFPEMEPAFNSIVATIRVLELQGSGS
jgi:hypothetical protein